MVYKLPGTLRTYARRISGFARGARPLNFMSVTRERCPPLGDRTSSMMEEDKIVGSYGCGIPHAF